MCGAYCGLFLWVLAYQVCCNEEHTTRSRLASQAAACPSRGATSPETFSGRHSSFNRTSAAGSQQAGRPSFQEQPSCEGTCSTWAEGGSGQGLVVLHLPTYEQEDGGLLCHVWQQLDATSVLRSAQCGRTMDTRCQESGDLVAEAKAAEIDPRTAYKLPSG